MEGTKPGWGFRKENSENCANCYPSDGRRHRLCYIDTLGKEVLERVVEHMACVLTARGERGATDAEVYTRSLFAGISRTSRESAMAILLHAGRVRRVRVHTGRGRPRVAWVMTTPEAPCPSA